MFRVVFVIMVAIVANSWARLNKSCQNLPRLPIPKNEVFMDASPLTFFISTPIFSCSNHVFSNSVTSGSGFAGLSITIRGSAIIVYDYQVDNDGVSAHTILCGLGIYQKWHVGIFNSRANNTDYCLFSCNGDALLEYACASNHGTTKAMVKKAVNFVKGTLGWERVISSQAKCPKIKGCKFF